MSRRKKYEGSLHFVKGKNLWRGLLQVGYNANGKPNRQAFYGKTELEVLEKMRAIAYQVDTSTYVKPDKITVTHWLKQWLEIFKKRQLKPKSYNYYKMFIEYHVEKSLLGRLHLQEVKLIHIQQFINYKCENLGSETIKKMHSILSAAFNQALYNEMIHKNPCKGTILPKSNPKQVKAFSIEEQNLFLEIAKTKTKLHDMFVLAIDSGLRLSEISALTWTDIDFGNGTIDVNKNVVNVRGENGKFSMLVQDMPKTKAGIRMVPLTARCISMLKQRKLANGNCVLVFPTIRNHYFNPQNVDRSFRSVLKTAKLKGFSFHSLRHTFCTRMLEAGVIPKIVQELAGHKDIATTLNTYSHVLPNKKHEAIALMEKNSMRY